MAKVAWIVTAQDTPEVAVLAVNVSLMPLPGGLPKRACL